MNLDRNIKHNIPKRSIAPSQTKAYNDENTNPLSQTSEQFAQKMIVAAKEKSIPIQEDSTLLKHLLEIDLGDSVPPQIYALIAEILNLMDEAEKQ